MEKRDPYLGEDKPKPLVSVMIPMYNAEDFVGRCLESVFSQTYSALEVLIVDDASTDRSQEIVLEKIAQFHREDATRLIRLEQNVGLAGVRQVALDASSGAYLLWLDSDDYWHDCEVVARWIAIALETNAPIVVSPYIADFAKKEVFYSIPSIPEGKKLAQAILEGRTPGFLCNKLVERSHFLRYAGDWVKGYNVLEDVGVMVPLLYHTPRVAFTDFPCLHYVQTNTTSYMTSLRPDSCHRMVAIVDRLKVYFQEKVHDQEMLSSVEKMYLQVQKMLYVRITPASYPLVRSISPKVEWSVVGQMPWRYDEKVIYYLIQTRVFSCLGYVLLCLEGWVKKRQRG